MPLVTPFDLPGQFYRGNLHTHSTRSDGKLTPAELAAAYQAAGYDFLCVSDHLMERFGWPITDTRDLRTERFTTLIGAELHAPRTTHWAIWHLLGVGLPLDFAPPTPDETGAALAARAAAAGAFIGIAHPSWYSLTPEDANSIAVAHAVEVYNHNCEISADRGDGWGLLETLLHQGRRLGAIASDDAHFHVPDAFGGWIMLKAPSLDPDALLTALKAGHYYASQGPSIHAVEFTSDTITVTSTPADRVLASWHGNRRTSSVAGNQTTTVLDRSLLRDVPYIRITVVDRFGRKAWTNPIWLDETGD